MGLSLGGLIGGGAASGGSGIGALFGGSSGGSSSGSFDSITRILKNPLKSFAEDSGKIQDLPELSDAEKGLLEEQTAAIRQGLDISKDLERIQKALQPIIFEQAGFKPIMENGEIVGFEPVEDRDKGLRDDIRRGFLEKTQAELDRPDFEDDEQLLDISRRFLERTQAALAGDLPLDPALMRDLKERESTFEKQLIQEFGSKEGAFKSTAGQQFFSRFGESQEILKDKARRADLTLSTQLGLDVRGQLTDERFAAGQDRRETLDQFGGFALQTEAAEQDRLRGQIFKGQSIAGLVTGQGFNQAAAGFGSAQQALAQNREFLSGIQQQRSDRAAQNVGIGVGALGSFFSSKALKENFEQLPKDILQRFELLLVEMWNYKGDDVKHIGPYAEDFKALFGVGDGKTIAYVDIFGVLSAVITKQNERIRALEERAS